MHKLSEDQTRKQLIDPVLERVGWRVKGNYIKEENNPVKSNYKTKEYVGRGGEIERGKDMFIDYLLLDEDRTPLAIVEAKKTSPGSNLFVSSCHRVIHSKSTDFQRQSSHSYQLFHYHRRGQYHTLDSSLPREGHFRFARH